MASDPRTAPDTGPRPTAEPAAADPSPPDRPPGRRGARRGRSALLVAGVIGLVLLVLLGAGVIRGWSGWLPDLGNPFAERTTDRSQPAILKSIQDLSRFTAASGNFEVVIDVERDRRFIPDVVLGERTLFVAAGSVDAYVEFGGLAEGALVVDEANDAVAVTLPAPQLERPHLDHDRSYVFAEQRGVVNRIGDLLGGDPDRLQPVLQAAEARIAEAAVESGLRERAEENTRKLLEGMLGSLGFATVTVTFQAP
jgi:hypothetical protein